MFSLIKKKFISKVIQKNIRRILRLFGLRQKQKSLQTKGKIRVYGKDFHYHYQLAFQVTYNEIIEKGIYTFNTHKDNPVIIDCGANMGVSLLFFSTKYPNAKIYAFEPDESVIGSLEKNIETYQMHNVELFKKAVWDSNGYLKFYTDEGLGGRLDNDYNNQNPMIVETIRLKDFIGQRHIDFLKMDIEGAEYRVIKDCEPVLNQIDNIFIEYHSIVNEEQKLDNILYILKKNGFRYHLSQSFSRDKPFIENILCNEKIDLAINIYGYR